MDAINGDASNFMCAGPPRWTRRAFRNHSCEPNTGLLCIHAMESLRFIRRGEQITMDYRYFPVGRAIASHRAVRPQHV